MTSYTRPFLYAKQEAALFNASRYALIEASTKSGKTVGALAWITERALAGASGQDFWWVSPGYIQSDIAYRRIKSGLTPGSFTKNDGSLFVTLLNGTRISFKSGDNADSLYGEDVYAAVVDEASRVREDAWFALRSTLTATRGPVRLIGNVKGRKNWFYAMARKAESGEPDMHYARITAQDAIAAGVIDAAEVEDARRMLPANVFRELYEAEPSDDGGNPFGLDHIRACVKGLSAERPVAFGIDLAKKQDWFVVIGLDASGTVASFHRWQGIPWRASIRRVHEIVGEDVPALVDSTGLGDPVLEELQHEHSNFAGFHFGLLSKQRLMEGLAVSIQGHELGFPDGPIVSELENFEYEVIRTGVRYTAAEGHNDDCVCALALAREQWTTLAPGANMMKFYAQQAAGARSAAEQGAPPRDTLPPAPASAERLDNELAELYRTALAANAPLSERRCAGCGELVTGPTRASDGFNVWHPECVGLGPRFARAAT